MTGTHILSKQNFLLLRPSWMPSWISQSAINYTNLCWHFQILQTMPNILVYDTSLEKNKIFFLATILDAILDFSARHQLCQFMPQFQKLQTMPNSFVYDTSCSTGGGGGGSGLPLEIVAFLAHSHPTKSSVLLRERSRRSYAVSAQVL